MARTKQFSREKALEQAMMLFWSQGYTATSVQQLLDVMGISRSSMYSEFGSKRDLFLEVLHCFSKMEAKLIKVISDAGDPVSAVRNFYEKGFYLHPDKTVYKGCLLVNSILELDDVDNELKIVAAGYLIEIEKAFEHCFKKCAENGTLQQWHDPKALAGFFITVIKGMRVASREKPGEDYLQDIIETALFVFQGTVETSTKKSA